LSDNKNFSKFDKEAAFSFNKLADYMASVGTMDVEAIRMILPSADLGAFLGQRA